MRILIFLLFAVSVASARGICRIFLNWISKKESRPQKAYANAGPNVNKSHKDESYKFINMHERKDYYLAKGEDLAFFKETFKLVNMQEAEDLYKKHKNDYEQMKLDMNRIDIHLNGSEQKTFKGILLRYVVDKDQKYIQFMSFMLAFAMTNFPQNSEENFLNVAKVMKPLWEIGYDELKMKMDMFQNNLPDALQNIIKKLPMFEAWVYNVFEKFYFPLLNGTKAPTEMKLEIWNEVIKTGNSRVVLDRLIRTYKSKIEEIRNFEKRIDDKHDRLKHW
jgi:hypothetical protein